MKTEEELRTLKRIIENYRDADPKRFADDRLSINWLWVLNWVLEESGENIDYDFFSHLDQ